MNDALDALQRTGDDILIPDVTHDQLGIAGEVVRSLAVSVDLLDQTVEHAHFVTAAKKILANCATDKAGTACD
jgi:hypothetical protein